jgi:hypothetical protein
MKEFFPSPWNLFKQYTVCVSGVCRDSIFSILYNLEEWLLLPLQSNSRFIPEMAGGQEGRDVFKCTGRCTYFRLLYIGSYCIGWPFYSDRCILRKLDFIYSPCSSWFFSSHAQGGTDYVHCCLSYTRICSQLWHTSSSGCHTNPKIFIT